VGDSTIEDSTFITKGCGGGGDGGEDGGEYDHHHHLNYSNGLDQPNSMDLMNGVDQPPCEMVNQSKDGGFDELSKTGRIDPFDDSIDNHNQDSRIMNNNDDNNSWFGDTSILSETIGNITCHIKSHIHTIIIRISAPL
jgi:hypothetical protein